MLALALGSNTQYIHCYFHQLSLLFLLLLLLVFSSYYVHQFYVIISFIIIIIIMIMIMMPRAVDIGGLGSAKLPSSAEFGEPRCRF